MTASVDAASRPLRIVIAGGGTGGHLYPAIAIAEAFRRHDPHCSCLFIGTARGLESKVVPALGYRLELLPVQGLLRRMSLRNLLVPWRLLQSVRKCLRLFREFSPDLVIGTGGYVSGPALLTAWWSRRAFVIQEQNNYPGLVNRMLGNRAAAVFLSFDDDGKYFKRRDRVFVVGSPVRSSLAPGGIDARRQAAAHWQLEVDKTTLLVFGGSQGALGINRLIEALLPDFAEINDLQILWATGPSHYERVAPLIATQPRLRVVPFIEDMDLAYAMADLALCRAGSTIFELTQCGMPSILIPYPFATADHQTHNARALEQAGAAVVMPESTTQPSHLLATIRDLVDDPARRQKMSAAAKSLAKPRAADDIVDHCLKLLKR